MKQISTFSAKDYKKENPSKAKMIKRAVKQGIKDYEETFKKLATT